jgi:hypothetical protein
MVIERWFLYSIALPLSLILGPNCYAQQATAKKPPSSGVLLDNKHLRVEKFEVSASGELALPALENDSLLLITKGDGDVLDASTNRTQSYRLAPREVVWLKRDEEKFLRNEAEQPSTILRIEFKDSYTFDQMQVPGSLRDPINFDTKHFRLLLENQHARIFLLHLDPMETSEEVQLPLHLEIPFTDSQIYFFAPDGKFVERHTVAESVEWGGNRLAAISNRENHSFDELIVELRHPFCYKSHDESFNDGSAGARAYVHNVFDRIRKQWLKRMPGDVKSGEEHGSVTVRVKIRADGQLEEDDTLLMEVFGESRLTSTALHALREAAPFREIPQDWGKPFLDFQFTFLYNLKMGTPAGCEP